MLQFPSLPLRKTWVTALSSLAALGGVSNAQDFTMMVTNPNPLGLGAFVPTGKELELGVEGTFKGDVHYGIEVLSEYDSNFFQLESNEDSELALYVTPSLGYTSDPEGGAMISFVANYTPRFRCYAENSDLNGVDQSGDATLSIEGSRTHIDLFCRYAELSGTDRLTGDYVEGSLVTTGFRADRQIAARTSLNAGWSYASSDYGSSDNVGSQINTAYFGGLWESTPRVRIGPSLRYTKSESDNAGTRDAWALFVDARYRLGERIWISASVGPEYSRTSDNGRNDTGIGLTGDLSALYVMNERWTWAGSIRSATVPSPSRSNNQVNNVALDSTFTRALLRGSVDFGLQYNYSEYNDVGNGAASVPDEQNMSAFVTYQRPMFNDRVDFYSRVRYTFNDGSTDWSKWVVSAGLSVGF